MFFENLRDYVFRRNPKRLRDDRISLIIAFAASMWMLLIGQPEKDAAIWGLIVLGISMLVFTVYYCQSPATATAKHQRSRRDSALPSTGLYRPVTRRLAAISAAALLVLFPLPAIEAAVLDQKLRRLIQGETLDREAIGRIKQTLSEGERYGVKPSSRTIAAVQAKLKKTSETDPSLSADATIVAAAAASTSTINIELPPDLHGPLFDSKSPDVKGTRGWFTPIATNTGPDNYQFIGFAYNADAAIMEKMDQPLPLPPEGTKYGPAFMVVKGLTATLDGWHLKHVLFQDMKLLYNGGPLLLESVYFINCKLEFTPGGNSWELISSVTKGGWISASMR